LQSTSRANLSSRAHPLYNSGYISSAEFWRNGTVYGLIFLAALLLMGVPLR
jgi:hypothetical protein